MKLNIKHIVILLVAAVTLMACDRGGLTTTGQPILLAPTEAGNTRAMLDAASFNMTGNQIRVYDYYTPTSGDPFYYFATGNANDPFYGSDIAQSNGNSWPFLNKHEWTPDGVHKFFGWLEKDVAMGETMPFTPTFNSSAQTLTIPQTPMSQTGTSQYDFMYSEISVRDLEAPNYTPVPMTFKHLFTAFKITAANYSSNDVWLKKVSINGLKNTKGATINYSQNEPVVTITESADAQPENFVYNVSDEGMEMTKKQTYNISNDFQLMWPQSRVDFEEAQIVVDYKYKEPNQESTSPIDGQTTIDLKDMFSWEKGEKNNLGLTFKDKEIALTCKVEPWTVVADTIDFTTQISVSNPLTWVPNSVESVDYPNGEVVLYSDMHSVAICNFHIDTPAGATWTASLIPVEGHSDAFAILDNTKYGAVGVDSEVHIQVTNMAPYAPKHVVKLRITVQTADGRTIIANMMPSMTDPSITEFKLIQNII